MNAKSVRTLLTFIVFICASPVFAQGEAYLGPHLGIQKAADADNSNYLLGATMRLKLTPFIGAEGAISYRQEEYADEAVTVRNWPITVSGLVYPLPILYGGIGAGWYYTTYDYDESINALGFDDNTEQEFGWHLGAGIELPTSENVMLTGDIRYVFLDYEFADLPDAVTEDDDADFYSITVGLHFKL